MRNIIKRIKTFISTKKIIIIGFLFLIFISICFGIWIYSNLFKPNTSLKDEILHIPTGAKFEEVMDSIRPMILNERSFCRVARLFKYDKNVKSGMYLIPKKIGNYTLIRKILISKQQKPVRLVLNNLESFEDFASSISKQLEVDSLAITKEFKKNNFLTHQNKSNYNLSHLIIPNTYFVSWDSSPEDLHNRMILEYRSFWNKTRQAQAKKLKLTPKEVSILASIIQKETSKKDEMKRVAGLYLNRLRRNWKLESDPTVIFALRNQMGKKSIINRVLYKDLKINSPYNTYINFGLPPNPISIPNCNAIDAVLNAESHKFMYMCASVKRFGYHEFAITNIEHKRNRIKYIAWLRKQKITR